MVNAMECRKRLELLPIRHGKAQAANDDSKVLINPIHDVSAASLLLLRWCLLSNYYALRPRSRLRGSLRELAGNGDEQLIDIRRSLGTSLHEKNPVVTCI